LPGIEAARRHLQVVERRFPADRALEAAPDRRTGERAQTCDAGVERGEIALLASLDAGRLRPALDLVKRRPRHGVAVDLREAGGLARASRLAPLGGDRSTSASAPAAGAEERHRDRDR